jgi:hypothetical protein
VVIRTAALTQLHDRAYGEHISAEEFAWGLQKLGDKGIIETCAVTALGIMTCLVATQSSSVDADSRRLKLHMFVPIVASLVSNTKDAPIACVHAALSFLVELTRNASGAVQAKCMDTIIQGAKPMKDGKRMDLSALNFAWTVSDCPDTVWIPLPYLLADRYVTRFAGAEPRGSSSGQFPHIEGLAQLSLTAFDGLVGAGEQLPLVELQKMLAPLVPDSQLMTFNGRIIEPTSPEVAEVLVQMLLRTINNGISDLSKAASTERAANLFACIIVQGGPLATELINRITVSPEQIGGKSSFLSAQPFTLPVALLRWADNIGRAVLAMDQAGTAWNACSALLRALAGACSGNINGSSNVVKDPAALFLFDVMCGETASIGARFAACLVVSISFYALEQDAKDDADFVLDMINRRMGLSSFLDILRCGYEEASAEPELRTSDWQRSFCTASFATFYTKVSVTFRNALFVKTWTEIRIHSDPHFRSLCVNKNATVGGGWEHLHSTG